MLIYENISSINFIALATAEATNDNNVIISRLYNNNVEVYYTIDEKSNVVHLLYIEAKPTNKGKGTIVLNDFIKEFSKYDIITDALFYLKEWYESLNFKYEYAIDEMLCFRMRLYRKENFNAN